MAGGMILMGIFSLLLSIPAAMVLHGVAQTVSNGSRVWLYRRHICWSILLPYSIGALALPLEVYACVVVAAVMGNWLASHIVERINDEKFKRTGRYVILLVGFVYMGAGISALL
jgi:uncharacterized membrane protein YfcA